MAFDLVRLLDYEAQLARDNRDAPDRLRSRDAEIRGRILDRLKDKRLGLLSWLDEMRDASVPWPGAVMVRAYDAMVFVLFAVGFLAGIGVIQVLLRYDGTEPVNVIPFLAIYGVLQIAFLVWYFLKSLVARLFKRLPGGAFVSILKAAAGRWLAKHPEIFSFQNLDVRIRDVFLQRLKDIHSRLLAAKAWQAFQVFGLAYHLASLLTFVLMLTVNDYTFAWRTTLQMDSAYFFQVVSVLGAPFAWISEILRPSLELIENSQFDRFQKGFLRGSSRFTVDWWPYLAALIFTYGLLPRLLLWLGMKASASRYLRSYVPADFQSEGLWQRLKTEQVTWSTSDLEPLRPVPDQALAEVSKSEKRSGVLVAWRDASAPLIQLEVFLKEKFQISVVKSLEAKGLSRESPLIRDALSKNDCLVIVSDPFELPGEAIDKIRQAVRERFPDLLILFAPLKVEGEKLQFAGDRQAWSHALKIFRDPYLGLLQDVL